MGKTRRDIVVFIIIAVISAVGLGAMSSSRRADELISLLFCRPVATVIALISDGQINVTGNESVVITPGLKLRIPPSCSAFGFFLTLTFVLFCEGVRSRRRNSACLAHHHHDQLVSNYLRQPLGNVLS